MSAERRTNGTVHRQCVISNDVETHSIWHNELRDDTGERVLKEGMPLLLELYSRFGIQSTFFFTGYIAKRFPNVVRMILSDGHEVGCHGLSHEVRHGFDVMSLQEQCRHLEEAKAILEDVSGCSVVSFRAPALRVNKHTSLALAKTGFKFDSSIAPQRFDAFLSFGGKSKLKWLGAPRTAYRTKADDLSRRGSGPIVEVPLSAFLYPYVGTTLRMTPTLTRAVRSLLHMEGRIYPKPIVFDIHPNEFIEEGGGTRTIARRVDGFVTNLLKDQIRGRLKVRNLGRKALPLYERELAFFRHKGYAFSTVREYGELLAESVIQSKAYALVAS